MRIALLGLGVIGWGGIFGTMAGEIGASSTTAEAIRQTFEQAVAGGRGQQTVPEIIAFLAENR